MITYSNSNNDSVWELYGKSSDIKPTSRIPNGSTYYEMDTGKVYIFDEEDAKWWEV